MFDTHRITVINARDRSASNTPASLTNQIKKESSWLEVAYSHASPLSNRRRKSNKTHSLTTDTAYQLAERLRRKHRPKAVLRRGRLNQAQGEVTTYGTRGRQLSVWIAGSSWLRRLKTNISRCGATALPIPIFGWGRCAHRHAQQPSNDTSNRQTQRPAAIRDAAASWPAPLRSVFIESKQKGDRT